MGNKTSKGNPTEAASPLPAKTLNEQKKPPQPTTVSVQPPPKVIPNLADPKVKQSQPLPQIQIKENKDIPKKQGSKTATIPKEQSEKLQQSWILKTCQAFRKTKGNSFKVEISNAAYGWFCVGVAWGVVDRQWRSELPNEAILLNPGSANIWSQSQRYPQSTALMNKLTEPVILEIQVIQSKIIFKAQDNQQICIFEDASGRLGANRQWIPVVCLYEGDGQVSWLK